MTKSQTKIWNGITANFHGNDMDINVSDQLKHHLKAQLEAEVRSEQQWRGLRNRGRSPIIQSR